MRRRIPGSAIVLYFSSSGSCTLALLRRLSLLRSSWQQSNKRLKTIETGCMGLVVLPNESQWWVVDRGLGEQKAHQRLNFLEQRSSAHAVFAPRGNLGRSAHQRDQGQTLCRAGMRVARIKEFLRSCRGIRRPRAFSCQRAVKVSATALCKYAQMRSAEQTTHASC